MAFCTGIVSRLVAASVRIAGHRQASPGALVDRDAFLRFAALRVTPPPGTSSNPLPWA